MSTFWNSVRARLQESAEWALASGSSSLYGFYADKLMGDLFNGCLTLGGFLLAAYTFIVIHMKTEVFDTEHYKRRFETKLKADSKLTRYGPLKNLSRRLLRAVAATFIAGLLQLTLGLWEANIAAVICITSVIWAVYEVIVALWLMGENIRVWFDAIEEEASTGA